MAKPPQSPSPPGEHSLNLDPAIELAQRYSRLGLVSRAEDVFQQILHHILQSDPNQPVALHLLGAIGFQLGKNDFAIDLFTKSIKADPENALAHNSLGVALKKLRQWDKAVASYRKAIEIIPHYADAHNNLGNALKELGEMDEAVASYEKAIEVKPDYAEAYNNLGNGLKALGRLEEAITSYRKAQAMEPQSVTAGRNLIYGILNVPGLTQDELFTEHLRFSEAHAQGITGSARDLSNERTSDRRLRIGYLSSDFRDHPVGSNLIPLLASHDHESFEVFCYADVALPDAMTERFQSAADHWRPITGMPDSEVAALVRGDEVDLLVCMAGRFDTNRPLVAAHRAAPVQISFHDGATSGLGEMDYWLTDGFLHPPETKEKFSEELYRLPVFYQYLPIGDAPPVGSLPAETKGFITFASFNNPAKVNEKVISLWAEVLKSVPQSRLMLKYKNWYGQTSLRHRLVESFGASGIEEERIIFEAPLDTLAEHCGRYGSVDIALDPFPFSGATTSFQALWMGVPVVSLKGESFINRAAGSMLFHAGLGELAVDTGEAYLAAARDLAGDREHLKTMRRNLREQLAGSPLCDGPAYARNVEAAYREMWREWCAGPGGAP